VPVEEEEEEEEEGHPFYRNFRSALNDMVVTFSTITPTAMMNMISHGGGMYLSVLMKSVNKYR
jgi:hypothetical protein